MKISDKIGSMYEITCGCGHIFQHHERVKKIFCTSCGKWGSMEELKDEEGRKRYEIEEEDWKKKEEGHLEGSDE